MENWGGGSTSPPQPVQNLEILLTFLILRVERSDLVRISDKLFSKLELDFEMLTWISWISRWSFVAFRGDSRWSYSIVNTTENQQSCPSSVWLQNSDRSHLQYLRDCCQGSRQFSMLVRSGFKTLPFGLSENQIVPLFRARNFLRVFSTRVLYKYQEL